MSILDRLPFRLQRKTDTLPILSREEAYVWQYNPIAAMWSSITPEDLAEYYTSNPIVHACVRVIADAFSQAHLKAVNPKSGEELPNHPVSALLRRPNDLMGQAEFWRYVATYLAFGGNAFIHMVPTIGRSTGAAGGKQVGELWPYSILQMCAVPEPPFKWVGKFAHKVSESQWMDVPTQEVVHVKWAVDPKKPWTGLSPLAGAQRAIDTHNEFTRTRKVLLENDATPRSVIKLPAGGMPLTPDQRANMRRDFRALYGGDRKGGVGVLENGADIVRMALTYDELQASELVAQLEADICASFGVHPIIAKVKLGLDKSTYSNYEEAVHDFTQSNLVPMWESVASEFTNAMQPIFGDNFELRFDLTEIQALKEDQSAVEQRVSVSLQGGLRTLNESRRLIGEPDVDGGDVWYLPNTVTVSEELVQPVPPAPPAPPEPSQAQSGANSDQPMDGEDMPPADEMPMQEGDAAQGKAFIPRITRQRIEAQIAQEVKQEIRRMYFDTANRI